MGTLKEKYSGKKGVYYYMFRKLEKINNEFGCYFEINEKDFVTDLFEMGVTLQDFLDVFQPLSVTVKANEQDGVPFAIPQGVQEPKVYIIKDLGLRWNIRYSEPKATYEEDELHGKQFEPEFISWALEFDCLSFTFEDKKLLKNYLKRNLKEFFDIKTLKKKKEPRTGVYDGSVYIKGKIFGNLKSPEQELRISSILESKENKRINYIRIFDDTIRDNSVFKAVQRMNKSIFLGQKVIKKDGAFIYWTTENLDK